MTRGKSIYHQRLRNIRLGPLLILALLLAVDLAVAGCSYGRAAGARHVTPPDPPPVPRAKPVAGTLSSQPAIQQAAAGQDARQGTASRRVHVVTEGQSLYAIARLYGLSIPSLIETNQLAPPYKLAVGQQLVVPDRARTATAPAATQMATAVSTQVSAPTPAPKPAATPAPAATHVVQSGDTVYSIAQRYQVDMDTLVRLNTIPDSYFISPGQRLLLPSGPESGTDVADKLTGEPSKLDSAAMQPAARTTTAAWTPSGQPAPAVAMMPPPEVSGPIPDAPPRASDKFLWPVQGKLLLNFGPKEGGLHNDGINIAAPLGTPVLAAENGVVAYVGNELRGFGNLLLIKHDGGWMTAYAHNEEILVGRGAKVERGQTVARVGDTGSVVTPQLHFEIRRGTRAVDPAKLLSPRQSAQTM
jgi:murein DD-endopeptidase MepM/ murein hydrolase activator NlpD